MPKNSGRRPGLELVDIRLRNGHVVRDTSPDKWRWKPWPSGPDEWDIVDYQVRNPNKSN